MSRPIADLPLPHFLKKALKDKEYETVDDLATVTAPDLALELSIGVAQAEDVLRQAETFRAGPSRSRSPDPNGVNRPNGPNSNGNALQPPPIPFVRGSQLQTSTAAELLYTVISTRFSTCSTALDELIAHFAPARPGPACPSPLNLKGKKRAVHGAGAICPGMVVEFSGPPGGGKTCVAVAAAVSARLVGDDGRQRPEVLLIGMFALLMGLTEDTEGSITSDRVAGAVATILDDDLTGEEKEARKRQALEGIHFIRVPTQAQMVALLHCLDEWLEAHPKVKLVIIDTLSYHFRQPTLELNARKSILKLAKKVIGQAGTVHGCAVIITTQLATKMLTSENRPANFETSDRAVLMPQLGDSWTTERTVRIALFRGGAGDDLRYAHASTSVSASSNPGLDDLSWASFDIDNAGLPCDVPPVPEDPEDLAAEIV